MSLAVGPQNLIYWFNPRFSLGDKPLVEVCWGFVKRLPLFLRGQFPNTKVAKADGIGEASQAQVTAAQTVAQLRDVLDVEILHQFAVGPDAKTGPVHQDAA